jgi:hypothetical protein
VCQKNILGTHSASIYQLNEMAGVMHYSLFRYMNGLIDGTVRLRAGKLFLVVTKGSLMDQK